MAPSRAAPLAVGAHAAAGLARPVLSGIYVRTRCPSRLAQERGRSMLIPTRQLLNQSGPQRIIMALG